MNIPQREERANHLQIQNEIKKKRKNQAIQFINKMKKDATGQASFINETSSSDGSLTQIKIMDHLWSNNEGSNVAKQRTQIRKFLTATTTGQAELDITAQNILVLWYFLAYCCCYCFGTMRKFWSNTQRTA